MAKTVSCPACGASISVKGSESHGHLLGHVAQITNGDHAGEYMWACGSCRSDPPHHDANRAVAGLVSHFRARHGVIIKPK